MRIPYKNIISTLLAIILTILSIELVSALFRYKYTNTAERPIYLLNPFPESDPSSPRHPCNRMKTDVLLWIAPDTQGECTPKAGEVINDYILYDANRSMDNVILTLGGSSTSGFYQYISKGDTWPKLMADLSKDKYSILNGGVGSYSSLQVLYKFLRDGPRIKNLRYVVDVSGYNDLPPSQEINRLIGADFPFLAPIQNQMNLNQSWIDQRHFFGLYSSIPNTMFWVKTIAVRLFKIQSKQPPQNKHNDKIFSFIDAADRWQNNVERLNLLVKQQNAKYILFLQPSIGLEGPQSSPKPGSSDEIEFNKLASNKNLLINLRLFYGELRKRCSKMDFCHDMSNTPNPSGNMYFDYIHPNEFGNEIISKKIWELIVRQ